jgi:uncharacterized alkaline shock family protein YloU
MEEELGKVIIAPGVLVTIAKLTTLSVPGVARMSAGRIIGRGGIREGVKIEVEDNSVGVDLYIVAEHDVNMLQLGQRIQSEVARAIKEIVGMEVSEVNVHIEDVEIPKGEEP